MTANTQNPTVNMFIPGINERSMAITAADQVRNEKFAADFTDVRSSAATSPKWQVALPGECSKIENVISELNRFGQYDVHDCTVRNKVGARTP